MSAKMRAKMRVEFVQRFEGREQIQMAAVYGGGTNAEDNTFSKATPCASLSMTISNKALHGTINPGDTFYVDFTPAE